MIYYETYDIAERIGKEFGQMGSQIIPVIIIMGIFVMCLQIIKILLIKIFQNIFGKAKKKENKIIDFSKKKR